MVKGTLLYYPAPKIQGYDMICSPEASMFVSGQEMDHAILILPEHLLTNGMGA